MASHFYIRHSSIVVFNELLKPHMNEADMLAMISQSAGEQHRGPKGDLGGNNEWRGARDNFLLKLNSTVRLPDTHELLLMG